ncbi:MAG: pyroglutamyl-peptidase I [Proteobacteria bacterium]|nr:pyroglutamyl-peptidase I [Pseudomonadota bacterium]
MGTILLTGFEPYGNTPINPAEQVAHRLDGQKIGESKVVARIVPSTYFTSVDAVKAAMDELQPEAVVMMGEFVGRSMITVERIAQNLNDCTRYGLHDNAGVELQDDLTAPNGPAAYYTGLPLRAMVKAMREAGIPADISDAAGTFCCNHLMYGILHHVATQKLKVRAGWIHLPQLPEVAARDENLGTPSMSAETAAAGVRAGLGALVSHKTDIKDSLPSLLQN